jgi:hypothetical protein
MIPLALLLAVVTQTSGGASVDWSTGVVRASGGGAGDLRAPSAAIARASAERHVRARIFTQIAQLPVIGGGSVGSACSKHPERKERIEKLIEQAAATAKEIHYASDGGIEIRLELPLDAIAAALVSDETKVTSARPGRIIVVRRKAHPVIVPGGTVRYYESVDEARKDERLPDSPETVKVREISAKELASGPVAVVLQIPE